MEPSQPPALSGRWDLRILGWPAAICFLAPISTWAEVSLNLPRIVGYPLSILSFGLIFLLVFASVAFPVSAVACVLCVFSRRLRRPAAMAALFSAVLLALSLPSQILSFRIWDRGFRELARKSAPLVAAIRKYHANHHRPPPDLDALVTESYLREIPATPCACSAYQYEVCPRGNPWTLTVIPPFRGIGFDRFEYWPDQDYPVRGESGWYERVGDWAYYHE
ncbi:MAG: hypothetical protein HYY18_12895 [Planctomycetes bacterium]|nr:hypothetical protein [Planctomycetota bacterium]